MLKQNREDFLYFWRIFSLLCISSIIVVGLIVRFIYYYETKAEKDLILALQKKRIELMKMYITDTFNRITSDLRILAEEKEVREYFEFQSKELKEDLVDEFINFSIEKKIYDQIRLLDETGMEVIRVNYNGGEPIIVSEDKLRFKGNRYYFKNTFGLKKNEVFVSPFDLNIENGEIEQPIKPIIRFGTPVFDLSGEKKGIVLINFSGNRLLRELENYYLQEGTNFILLNNEGYWLKAINPEDEWGFMYEDRKDLIFKYRYPSVWKEINSRETGQTTTKQGIFTFTKVYPLALAQISSTGAGEAFSPSLKKITTSNYYWTLISFVPSDLLLIKSKKSFLRLAVESGILLLFIFLGAWIIALSTTKRHRAEKITLRLNDLLKVINKILRHDILNKLTGIRLSLMSYREYKNEKELNAIEEIADSGIELIDRMRNLERLAIIGDTLRATDIKKVLDRVVKRYEIPIEIKGEGVVLADEALGSVFDQIIRNAILHGKTKEMKIIISKIKKGYQIELADFGKGIPEEIREEIFKEGFRYGKTGHTGLGLYIVKKTIERYGGKVFVKPNKPKGAIFVIQLLKG